MKAVKDYEGRYSVTFDGKVYSHLSNRFMSTYLDRDGYERVGLMHEEGTQSILGVHRIVAMAYVDGDHTLTVNHKDGVKTNNHFKNLEWMSVADNVRHSVDNFLRGNQRVYDEALAIKVLSYTMDGWSKKEIAQALGIPVNSCHNIIYSPQYEYLRKEFNWENRPNRQFRLNSNTVLKIAKELEQGSPQKTIARKFNTTVAIVQNIKYRRCHQTLTKDFKF